MAARQTAAEKREAASAPVVGVSPGHPGPYIVGTVRRRDDDDALLGSFVDVISGEHQGRFGHFFDVAESEKDGVPKTALVRTRDANNEVLSVAYGDLRTSERRGGR